MRLDVAGIGRLKRFSDPDDSLHSVLSCLYIFAAAKLFVASSREKTFDFFPSTSNIEQPRSLFSSVYCKELTLDRYIRYIYFLLCSLLSVDGEDNEAQRYVKRAVEWEKEFGSILSGRFSSLGRYRIEVAIFLSRIPVGFALVSSSRLSLLLLDRMCYFERPTFSSKLLFPLGFIVRTYQKSRRRLPFSIDDIRRIDRPSFFAPGSSFAVDSIDASMIRGYD